MVQLIGVIIVPLLALNYNLEELGLYAFIFSLSTLFGNLICLRIENAFFSSSIEDVDKILPQIVFFAFIFLITSSLILCFLNLDLKYVYALYGGTLIALFNVFYNYNVRVGLENRYNIQKLIRAILELVAILISILLSIKVEFCVLLVLSTYVIFVVNHINLSFKFKHYFDFLFSKKDLILSDLASTFMFSLYVQAPSLFLASVDLQLAGLYFIVYKFCMVPSLMIAQSLGTVFKQYATIEYQSTGLVNNTLNNMKIFFCKYWLYILSFFIGLNLLFWGLNIFKYPGIFEVFLIMFFCMFFRFVHLSYSPLVYVLSMQKSYLVLNLLLFMVTSLSIFMSNENGVIYLCYYSFLSSILYLFYAFFFFNRIKV